MINKIFLTGASGFIGKNLHKILRKKKIKIVPIGYRNLSEELISCNLFNVKRVDKLLIGIDCIVHCAGYTNTSKFLTPLEKNKIWKLDFEITKTLIKLAIKNKVKKFIYISSSKVILEDSNKMILEDIRPNPKTEYAKSKLKSENYLLNISKKNEIDVICLRPTLVYGNGCKNNLKILLKLSKMNLLPEISAIKNRISLIHVSDLSNAIIKVILSRKKKSKIFTLSGPKDLSLVEMVHLIRLHSNKRKSFFKLNLQFFYIINIIIKKINLNNYLDKIIFSINKVLNSSFYEARKFNEIYRWKPKVYPFEGFLDMLKDK
jgi:UDP-glucose 4-epimerase